MEKVITVVEIEQAGISMEMVNICKEIRRLAMLDRIKLDETLHKSQLNDHLFAYIKYCGMDVKEYIKKYLSNLQPYMLKRFSSQEPDKDFICVFDQMYRVFARKCENGTFLVRRRNIEMPIIGQCDQYIRNLYTSDMDLPKLDEVEMFSVLHQISFTSYGNSVFSNISLLIDNLAMQKSMIGKQIVDFALITYAEHISLKQEQMEELFSVIDEKYKVSSQKNVELIIIRVKDVISSNVFTRDIPEILENDKNKIEKNIGKKL